jgi:hypothetical protein
MANGYLLYVAHPRDDFPELHVTYAVASAEENRARAILAEKVLANFPGTIYKTQALSLAQIAKLKLKDGECSDPIWPTHDV